ncbi:MAG: DEDD exonuclease domain-containing protein [Nitriliruptorales bacterium]|nr:DEDD exonuclease domain-containing protein [Nitriliruptorales bacterium]
MPPSSAVQPSFETLGTPLIDVTFVVVDLETTGLRAASDRITEIGAVKVQRGEVLGELQTLVHPGRPIPPKITAVTGITDHMVSGAPPVGSVLPMFLEFLGDAVLVAHNARFDTSFLSAALERHGYPRLRCQVIDTARLARRVLKDEVRNVRLATLARHLKARTAPEHRALVDARATVDVLHGLLERAGSLGATTLEDLDALTRSSSDRAFRKIGLVADAPSRSGVYRFLDDRGDVLYVGKATDLRSRLRTYFGQDRRRRIADLVRHTDRVEWTVTPTELEAAVREVRQIHRHRPRFNRRSKHPQRAVYLKLTTERFPRLSIVTEARDDGALYLGPLGSRKVAQTIADAVHEAIPLRQCTMRIRVAQDHPSCVLKDLGRCGAPCDGTQSVDDYDGVVDVYRSALSGDVDDLLSPLRERMLQLAREQRFERAGGMRQRLHRLATALAQTRRTAMLARTERIVARRPTKQRDEIAVIAWGRLVTTRAVRSGTPDAVVLADVDHPAHEDPGPVTRDDAEEVGLVASWLDGDGVRVVEVRGTWATPVAGGRTLSRTTREANRVRRQARRDRQTLRGAKVVRRAS